MALGEKAHIQYLDVLKGITIFLVVVGHAFHFGFAYYSSTLLYVLRSIDMPIFLLLSGMLGAGTLDFSLVGARRYWAKKLRQLLLPLCTLPFIYALIYGIDWEHLLLDRMHGGYWFTLTLFEMFVLLYLVRYINSLINKAGRVWVELLIALASLAFVLLIDKPWQMAHPQSWEALSWGKMDYLYYYFLLGYFVGRYRRLENWISSDKAQILSAIIFAGSIYMELKGYKLLEGIPASLSGAIMAYATAKKLGNSPSPTNKVLAYLGRESRSIYLTHYLLLFSAPMVGTFLKGLGSSQRIFLWEALSATLYALVVVVATLALVRLFRSSPYLDTLFYGKKFPRAKTQDDTTL